VKEIQQIFHFSCDGICWDKSWIGVTFDNGTIGEFLQLREERF